MVCEYNTVFVLVHSKYFIQGTYSLFEAGERLSTSKFILITVNFIFCYSKYYFAEYKKNGTCLIQIFNLLIYLSVSFCIKLLRYKRALFYFLNFNFFNLLGNCDFRNHFKNRNQTICHRFNISLRFFFHCWCKLFLNVLNQLPSIFA